MQVYFVLYALLPALLLSLWIPSSLSEDASQANLSEEELEELEESVGDMEYEIVDGFDPNDPTVGKGHINMASLKKGECPVIACNSLTKPKPCPEAKPEKVTVNWQGLECEVCPTKWDKRSCKAKKAADGSGTKKEPKMEKKEL